VYYRPHLAHRAARNYVLITNEMWTRANLARLADCMQNTRQHFRFRNLRRFYELVYWTGSNEVPDLRVVGYVPRIEEHMNSDLLCRPCERIVWSDEFRGDGTTVEWVYYVDGSTKESIFVEDDEIHERLHEKPIEHDQEGRPIARSLEEVWPNDRMDKVNVRVLHP
jgi:hypothetical protein